MEQNDQRNLMIAIGLMRRDAVRLYNFFVLEPAEPRARAPRWRRRPPSSRSPPRSPAGRPIARPAVIDGSRDASRACRSMARRSTARSALKGARIDDVSLKGFYETVTDKEIAARTARSSCCRPKAPTTPSMPTGLGRRNVPGLPDRQRLVDADQHRRRSRRATR